MRHFTSPIRRYADLIVHRALVRALDLGDGGLTDAEMSELAAIAESISATERRAMLAERETADRLIAAYLADRIGASFPGRASPALRGPASSCGSPRPAPTASCRPPRSVTSSTIMTRCAKRWWARTPERPTSSAIPSRFAWSRPSQARARSRFEMLSEGRLIGVKPKPRGARYRGRPQAARHGRPRGRR